MTDITLDSKEILTPALMAARFWEMDSIQQAEFFKCLAGEVKKTQSAYSYGEMQWLYLRDEVRKDAEANNMYMALSAWAFDFWPQHGTDICNADFTLTELRA